jgi:hypothetical protein
MVSSSGNLLPRPGIGPLVERAGRTGSLVAVAPPVESEGDSSTSWVTPLCSNYNSNRIDKIRNPVDPVIPSILTRSILLSRLFRHPVIPSVPSSCYPVCSRLFRHPVIPSILSSCSSCYPVYSLIPLSCRLALVFACVLTIRGGSLSAPGTQQIGIPHFKYVRTSSDSAPFEN